MTSILIIGGSVAKDVRRPLRSLFKRSGVPSHVHQEIRTAGRMSDKRDAKIRRVLLSRRWNTIVVHPQFEEALTEWWPNDRFLTHGLVLMGLIQQSNPEAQRIITVPWGSLDQTLVHTRVSLLASLTHSEALDIPDLEESHLQADEIHLTDRGRDYYALQLFNSIFTVETQDDV